MNKCGEDIVCKDCKRAFGSLEEYQVHRLTPCKVESVSMFKCNEPGCVYIGKCTRDLRAHKAMVHLGHTKGWKRRAEMVAADMADIVEREGMPMAVPKNEVPDWVIPTEKEWKDYGKFLDEQKGRNVPNSLDEYCAQVGLPVWTPKEEILHIKACAPCKIVYDTDFELKMCPECGEPLTAPFKRISFRLKKN